MKKSIEILDYVSRQAEGVSIEQIVDFSGLPKGTVMSHIATLSDAGFVLAAGDKFIVGMAAAMLWARRKRISENAYEKAGKELNLLEGIEE